MPELSPEETDAISEVLNIAIGQSARALSEMVDEPVMLSVPHVSMLPLSQAWREVDRRTGGSACAVKESFGGPFSGDALLIFPEKESLGLVRRLIGDDSDLEQITEMEEDALMELGNVILTSCTVSFADTFGIGLEQTSLPEVVRGRCSDILVSDRFGEDSRVLFLEVDFDLHNGGIAGIVLIALGIASANALRERVRIYLDALEA